MVPGTIDEHQIADVDDQARALPDDEHRVAAVNCVDGGDHAAREREVPEDDRNVARLLPRRGDPLDDEARAEEELADETEGDPKIPLHERAPCLLWSGGLLARRPS